MKRYLLLTSALALAACGGGSGGGNGGIIQNSGMRVSDNAIESNKNVTSMASEILIAQDNVSPNIVRSAKVVNDGKSYTAYHLDDAKFFENYADASEYTSFGIDKTNGQINKILLHWTDDDGRNMVESINRDGPDSSIFTENVYKYNVKVDGNTYWTDSLPIVKNGYTKAQIKAAFRDAYDDDDTLSDADWKKIDSIIDSTNMEPTEFIHHHVVDLQGKQLPESNQLRYSDFGFTTILAKEIHEDGDGVGDDNSVIFGGYEVKNIRNTANLRDATFTGKAIAAIGNVHQNGDTKIETADNAATLTIDSTGKQTLTMPFNDYYTINVEKPQKGAETITWTGTTNKGYELDNQQPVKNSGVTIKYYGDNGVPSEAVGGVMFQNNNVEFNGAFGVKK